MVDLRGTSDEGVTAGVPKASEDVALLHGFASGDHAATQQFLARYRGPLRRMAQAISRDPEDALHDALIDLVRGASTLDTSKLPKDGTARSWVFAVARNAMWRSARTLPVVISRSPEEEAGDSGPSTGEYTHTENPEARLAVREAFEALPVADREVLLLRDVEEFSAEEACAILTESEGAPVSVEAMKSRLHRARLRLASALGDNAPTMQSENRLLGGVHCTDVVAALPDLLLGTATLAQQAAARNHLAACTVCEQFGGRYGARVHHLREGLALTKGRGKNHG